MSEETLTEALSKLDDENINKAALPEHKRVEEDVQEEPTYIEFSEEEAEAIALVLHRSGLTRLLAKQKTFNAESCKHFSTRKSCKSRMSN